LLKFYQTRRKPTIMSRH